MSADLFATIIVAGMAPPATAFPIMYAFRPWYRSLLGWALMIYSTGLGLLIDVSLLYQAFGDNYPWRDVVRITVYLLIFVGVWGLTIAVGRPFFRPEDDA